MFRKDLMNYIRPFYFMYSLFGLRDKGTLASSNELIHKEPSVLWNASLLKAGNSGAIGFAMTSSI